ncbi:hypothetical protein H8K35_06500 [Undibacterium sp. LX40W]|uniref:Transposase IS200-like domain-containing protein n=1 Tax=Undibacterium nitidum TaxID=2762298 RepID=A0A923KMW0_9BURK|nr:MULTISPECIES: transposase [Undibacterium]MBC3879963.1 hypothetical protein [Undibacterium nitidum]MBC3891301.1 hypothetical protein [Undibacterium sp. LX40W]
MPTARKNLVSTSATPYYHCIGRCVRRAFLWGKDDFSGRDFSHRKVWITERLSELSRSFAVNVCAYAVMSNHYHLVVHVDVARAQSWSDQEVGRRWAKIFSLPLLVDRYLKGELAFQAEISVAQNTLALWRDRLCDLSWFMRALNEPIARRANEEDQCTGRFWDGRFKSQAILDKAGLLACCVDVGLISVRADIAHLPKKSDYTSIQLRLSELKKAVWKRAGPVVNQVKSKANREEKSLRQFLYTHSLPIRCLDLFFSNSPFRAFAKFLLP